LLKFQNFAFSVNLINHIKSKDAKYQHFSYVGESGIRQFPGFTLSGLPWAEEIGQNGNGNELKT